MRNFLLAAFAVVLSINAVEAQQARVRRYTTPLAGTVVLESVEDKYGATVYNMEMPDPDASAEQKKLQDIKEHIKELFPYKHTSQPSTSGYKKTSVPKPIMIIGYVSDSVAGIPPDNDMAMGKNDTTVSVMNDYLNVQNSISGAGLHYHKKLESFSAVVGLSGPNNYRYDPKIIYDPLADRYIAIMLNGTNAANYIVVGFSSSHNPLKGWNFYKFYGNYAGDTTWFDFPCIAITKDEFFFTGNKIIYDTTWQAGFKESVIYQVRKQDGYDGDTTLNYQIWDSIKYKGHYVRNLYPVKGGASIKGPDQYFLSNRNFDVRNDTFFLVKIPDTIGSATNALIVTPVISPIRYGVPPDGRQPDTAILATNDGRVLGAYAEGSEIQFVNTTVDSANGASAIYHGTISNYKTAPSLHGAIISIDTLDFGYPNLSYTGSTATTNQSIISFDYSGPHTYPGIGAIFYDGGQYSDMLNVRKGDGSINIFSIGHEQRWGDYTGSQPDWSAFGLVWVNGLYGRTAKNYGCYMAKLQSPYPAAVTQPQAATVKPAVIYPNPAEQFIKMEFTIGKKQPVSFFIYDIQGRVVAKILHTLCQEGHNLIQFNIATLTPGTYYLKAVGDDGAPVTSQSFVRQ